ncbi:uncharacterized protein [Vicugna pacos]|uniref:Uncharacterized protein isoform X1 n=1 Tax=Vicugna pacos TaxID=30538 RepID=A0ABM5CRB2_VICPA
MGGAGCSALYPLPAAAPVLRPARAACPGPWLPACDSGWVSRGPSVPVSLGSVGQGVLWVDLRLGGAPSVPSASPLERGSFGERALFLLCRSLPAGPVPPALFCFLLFLFSFSPTRFWASLSFEEGGVLSEFRRCSDWPSGSVDYSMNLLTRYLCFLGMGPSVSSSDGWTSVDSSRFSPLRKDFKRREDSQKSTISSRTAAVFELPIRSGRNTPHPHLKPPSPPPQPPAPPSSPALGAVVGHGGMLAGWSLVGVGVVEETGKQTTVARG